MSKYSVGDKFVIEIGEVFSGNTSIKDNKLYRVKSFRSLVFDKTGLDNLERLAGDGQGVVSRDEHNCKVNETYIRAYDKGLQDAWKIVPKIFGMTYQERNEFLGTNDSNNDIGSIIAKFTPQEALAKLEAYEKEQAEIKVGDVVRFKKHPSCEVLITAVSRGLNGVHLQTGEFGRKGEVHSDICKDYIEKTGKHINIESLFEQIAE